MPVFRGESLFCSSPQSFCSSVLEPLTTHREEIKVAGVLPLGVPQLTALSVHLEGATCPAAATLRAHFLAVLFHYEGKSQENESCPIFYCVSGSVVSKLCQCKFWKRDSLIFFSLNLPKLILYIINCWRSE